MTGHALSARVFTSILMLTVLPGVVLGAVSRARIRRSSTYVAGTALAVAAIVVGLTIGLLTWFVSALSGFQEGLLLSVCSCL
jgi:hypothetical protein